MARGDMTRSTGGERVMLDDSELNRTIFSPTCTYCAYWKPTDGQHCDAYPRGNTPRQKTPAVPAEIWSGASTHVFPFPNAEHPTDHGIHFEPHPAVVKLPAKIAADLKKRAAQEKLMS